MPHLVILYTANLERETNIGALCRTLGDTMLAVRDEAGLQLFPTGGTRVFAYPAPHFAVADNERDYAFIYLNVRMAPGRSDAIRKEVGDALLASAKAHLGALFERRLIGMTLQIDDAPPAYDGKHNNINALFAH
ncbi:MAG TPA: 5-carboxymethyl-2-hydroxymuconate isomerase [Ramlibacter sp.]|nr:5-carboxymethyl-2-hydroxymuconate isomerase [Ramlibacter sp.]